MQATVEPVHEMSDMAITTNRVIMNSFGHRKIRAWYTVPIGTLPEQGWPAVMLTPGYRDILMISPDFLARIGYATLTLFPREQGESVKEGHLDFDSNPGDIRTVMRPEDPDKKDWVRPSHVIYNITDRERYHYRGAYMDCIRGLDFLESRPEVANARLGLWGASQGGGLTLAMASLDTRPKAAVAAEPWLCNFPVSSQVTVGPYRELYDHLAQFPHEREIAMETLAYFDPLNLVQGITCPTLFSAAVIDEVHPYNTVMPVFEKIPALKSIVLYPDFTHSHGYGDFVPHGTAWLQRYLS